MSDAVKIHALEVENVKRVKAVSLDCSGQSLTVIGGRNGQGKTSLLDAIMWTLGGDRFRPSRPLREGAEKLATRVALSNGIVVERRGAGGSLKVTSPDGKGGQQLLNEFVSQLALDLPRFMNATAAEKAQMLLDLFPGLGAQLQRLNEEAKRLYGERHALGQIVTRKKKHAEDLPFHPDVPQEPLTGKEMTGRMQEALAVNARNDEIRRRAASLRTDADRAAAEVEGQKRRIAELEARLVEERQRLTDLAAKAHGLKLDAETAVSDTAGLLDRDTTALQKELEQIDAVNARVRQNMDKARAEAESNDLAEQYEEMTRKLEEVSQGRLRLLAGVEMPLPGLEIDEEGALVYGGQKWDGMSGAEQLRVAVAICAAVKPACGFVLLDGLERMDLGQLRDFARWLDARGLQAIGTRVSEGGECSLVIEDGSPLPFGSSDHATAEPAFKF
jgi:energy-coupling factor transporter ATP-binding protein EcfA2